MYLLCAACDERTETFGVALLCCTLFVILSALFTILICVLLALLLVVCVALLILIERKLLALSQRRVGPVILGRRGILQIVADVVKPVFKDVFEQRLQTVTITTVSVFALFFTQLLAAATYSFDCGLSVFDDCEFLIFIQLGLTTLSCISVVFIGGFSGSKYGLIGAIRLGVSEVANDAAVLTINSILFYNVGGFDYDTIMQTQNTTAAVFCLFVVGALVHTFQLFIAAQRSPVDLIEVEGELVAGYNTEFSGPDVLVIYFAEYFHLFNGLLHFVFVLFGACSFVTILF